MTNIKGAIATVLAPAHLCRTSGIALLVGSWLTAFNQGDVIVGGLWTRMLELKIVLNYFTPFVVANLGLLSRKPADKS